MSDQPETTPETSQASPPEADTPAGDGLTAGGKAAIEAERRARREAEREAREAKEQIAALERKELLRDVAASAGLNDEQAAFLSGSTREEIEASANALLAAFPAGEEKPASPGRRPVENLRSGNYPSVDDGPDAGALADRVMKW